MARQDIYLMDTNVAVLLCRAGPLADYIETNYRIRVNPMRPLFSVVSIGELFAFAKKKQLGCKKNWNLSTCLNVNLSLLT